MIVENELCRCGKKHINPVDELIVGKGVVKELPLIVQKYNAKKAFIIADINTYANALNAEIAAEEAQNVFEVKKNGFIKV